MILPEGDIKAGGIGFGGQKLAVPQAGLMASLASGIANNDMPWPLVCVGIARGLAMMLVT